MNRKTAICAEDDPLMQSLIRLTLNSLGYYNIISANNGLQVLAAMEGKHIELIVMDWNMPELDGIACTKIIRVGDLNPDVPIVLLTGIKGKENEKIAYDAGVNCYVEKPFSMRDLHNAISLVLNTPPIF